MRNAGLEKTQAGIKIAGRNINNLRYADDTMLTNYAWASKIRPGRPQCLLSFGRMEGRLWPM